MTDENTPDTQIRQPSQFLRGLRGHGKNSHERNSVNNRMTEYAESITDPNAEYVALIAERGWQLVNLPEGKAELNPLEVLDFAPKDNTNTKEMP